MSFNNQNLSVMAYANGFTLWNYSSEDTIANVKAADYFNDIAPFARKGDMILTVSTSASSASADVLFISNINEGVVSVTSLTKAA